MTNVYKFIFGGTLQSRLSPVQKDTAPMFHVRAEGRVRELEDSYDDTYGRASGTTGVQDLADTVGDLLPAGWTNYLADTKIYQAMEVTEGTTRRAAIQRCATMGAFRWRADPWRNLWGAQVARLPTTNVANATTNWTSDAGVIAVNADDPGGGGNSIEVTVPGAPTYLQYGNSLAIDIEAHNIFIFWSKGFKGEFTVHLYTGTYDVANYYSIGSLWGTNPDNNVWNRLVLRCPDSDGDHGWTANGAADYEDDVSAFRFTQADATNMLIYDPNFRGVADPIPALQVTGSSLMGASRSLSRSDVLSTVYASTQAPSTPHIADVPGFSEEFGDRELVVMNHNITADANAQQWAQGQIILNGLGYGTAEVSMPLDAYDHLLLQPGDTVHVTLAGAALGEGYVVEDVVYQWGAMGTEVLLNLSRSANYNNIPVVSHGAMVNPNTVQKRMWWGVTKTVQ